MPARVGATSSKNSDSITRAERELALSERKRVEGWRSIAIDRGDYGIRVDRVLLRHLGDQRGLSRNHIQKLVIEGAVLINGAPAPRVSWRVAPGDDLRVMLPEATVRERPVAEALPLDILFEDHHLLIVNKPAGQVVHPAYRNKTGTLLNAVLHHLSEHGPPSLVSSAPSDGETSNPGIVGRLDKLTSGLVMIAKRRDVQAALQRLSNENQIEKDYLAIVHGKPTPSRGTITLALDRDPWDRRRVMVKDRGGQSSVTKYQRIATSEDSKLSLVRCRLITGRTHQIRVHLSAKGWPIVGDAVYGIRGDKFARQALHAWRVEFEHPCTGKRIEVLAPVPADMQALLIEAGFEMPIRL